MATRTTGRRARRRGRSTRLLASPTILNRVHAALVRLREDLDGLGRRWALVGGLAVSSRTDPRFTRDADVVVHVVDDRDAEALVLALQGRGYRVDAALEQEATQRLATVRVVMPGETATGVVADLLFASSGIEPEIVQEADLLEIMPGLHVPVATVGHLIALKVLARDDRTRPQDRADLVALLATADRDALESAVSSVALITRRGYARGRDLAADVAALLAERGGR